MAEEKVMTADKLFLLPLSLSKLKLIDFLGASSTWRGKSRLRELGRYQIQIVYSPYALN